MSMKDGGPAFPVVINGFQVGDSSGEITWPQADGGMTLRDYFAAKALNGLLSDIEYIATKVEGLSWKQRYAFDAYELADAMLSAREKESQK